MAGQPSRLPLKPKFGEACNGCGLCCALELCVIGGIAFSGAQPPCPALKLTPDGSRTYCELVAMEKAAGLEPLIQRGLGIGLGCSMEDQEAA